MANELQILLNPDNIPGAVLSGYQRQNTNIFAIQTGLDTTSPYDNGDGTITIPEGGIIEYNGSLFKIIQNVLLTKSISSGQYFIGIEDNDDGTGNFILFDTPGSFNPAKNAYYNNDKRILNWVSNGRPTVAVPSLSDNSVVASLSGYQTQYYSAKKGWYRGILKAAGGGTGNNGYIGGEGGSIDIFFFLDKSTSIKLMSSSAGGPGISSTTGSYTTRTGGCGGGGTVIDLLFKQFIATGGGGGASGLGAGSSPNIRTGGGGGGGYGGGGSYINNNQQLLGGNGGGSLGAQNNLSIGGGPGGGGYSSGATGGNSGGYGGNGGTGSSSGGSGTIGNPGGNNVDNIYGGGAAASVDGSLILQYFA
jgi:hypothetical protein